MVYTGSKGRVAKYIVPILQKCIDDNNIDVYIEPFVGGANIIDKVICKRKIGYDINKYLIALLEHVRDNYQNEDCFPKTISKEHYINVRNSFKNNTNEFSDLEKGIVGFLSSYSSIFFTSYVHPSLKNGVIHRDYYQERKNNLLKQAINLQGIEFYSQDYKELSTDLKDVLIYCDIPYEGIKKYRVGNIDHKEFWEWARTFSLNNFVFVSSEKAPDDFITVWERENVYRSIGDVNSRSKKTEKLFVYKNGLLKQA